jgi:tetraacyldisaccharide 4'-kinase
VLAFAGIGRPEKFFDTLRALGCDIAEARSFADHHPYSRPEIDDLLATAARLNAVPVTTAKDAVRLPNDIRLSILTLDITLVWDDETALDRWLVERLTMPRT